MFRIDQVGKPLGTIGISRDDGVVSSLVTLTYVGSATNVLFRFTYVPYGAESTIASLTQTVDPKVWTFTPANITGKKYLIECIANPGTPAQTSKTLAFGVRSPVTGLLAPALNEKGSPFANLNNKGQDIIDATTDNAIYTGDPNATRAQAQYGAWSRNIEQLYDYVENLTISGGGSGDVVGTDTSVQVGEICTYATTNGKSIKGSGLLNIINGNTIVSQDDVFKISDMLTTDSGSDDFILQNCTYIELNFGDSNVICDDDTITAKTQEVKFNNNTTNATWFSIGSQLGGDPYRVRLYNGFELGTVKLDNSFNSVIQQDGATLRIAKTSLLAETQLCGVPLSQFHVGALNNTASGLRLISVADGTISQKAIIAGSNISIADNSTSLAFSATGFLPLTGGTLSGNVDFANFSITNLSNLNGTAVTNYWKGAITNSVSGVPIITVSSGAVSQSRLIAGSNISITQDTNGTTIGLSGSFLPLTGGTMTGSVDFGTNNITNLGSLNGTLVTSYWKGSITNTPGVGSSVITVLNGSVSQKTLIAGSNITLTESTNGITIASSGGGGGASLLLDGSSTMTGDINVGGNDINNCTDLNATNGLFGSYIKIGTNNVGTGAIRLSNLATIAQRNAADTFSIVNMFLDGSDVLWLGNNTNGTFTPVETYINANNIGGIRVNGVLQASFTNALATITNPIVCNGGYISIGTTPASSGIIRLPNNQSIIARNAANSADITLLRLASTNRAEFGSTSTTQTNLITQATTGVVRIIIGSVEVCNFGETNTVFSNNIDMSNKDIFDAKTVSFEVVNVATFGTTTTVDFANGQKQRVTLTGNSTVNLVAAAGLISNYILEIIQDATGGRVVTLQGNGLTSTIKSTSASINISQAANSTTILAIYFNGSNFIVTSLPNIVTATAAMV